MTAAQADHPQILATPAQKASIEDKVETAPWARTGYASLKARIDPLVAHTEANPTWMSSRMLMNWQTHYTTPLVENSRTVGGEGHAPVPTPRFEGARNWAANYSLPARIEDWMPYNDQAGKVYAKNNKTGQMEWVEPGQTGGAIRGAHQRMLGYAADGAFLYWLTGDEKYARFAASILWPFMEGFYYTTPPRPVTDKGNMMQIIGPTTFEVIHENVVISAAVAYDFLYPYLVKQGRDVKIAQEGFRRFAQRVTDGGEREGNWNLNQAMMIAYAGLALEPDAAYADRRGRGHFVDIVLNADLPRQKGITQVIREGFDPATALWPEAAGYGFGAAAQLIELSVLLARDPAGSALLKAPLLRKSLMNQGELLYPDGLTEGVGDTTNNRMTVNALENLIAWARESGETQIEDNLTPYLQREIAAGSYRRDDNTSLFALTHYVGQLRATAAAPSASRSFFFPGLNILMQRNLADGGHDAAHSLTAALYGTNGGHVHVNGLAIELYGAGYILGADPGRGASYWVPEHGEYYSQPPAHNTVIVNGASVYNPYPNKAVTDKPGEMRVASLEPASQQSALSPNIGWARGSLRYDAPVAAAQQRTLALIRTSPKSGFYFDVFRSRAAKEAGSFHDYLYHDMGQSLRLSTGADDPPLALQPSALMAQSGLLKGYRYFKNERSLLYNGPLCATWTLNTSGAGSSATSVSSAASMRLWMTPAPEGRTVVSLDAPSNNAIRGGLPDKVSRLLMPTLLVRQSGDAWNAPFVGIYEPYLAGENTILNVHPLNKHEDPSSLCAIAVEGKADGANYRVLLFDDAAPGIQRRTEATQFQGQFGAVFERGEQTDELYLGRGNQIEDAHVSLAAQGSAIDADLRRTKTGWTLSTSGPAQVSVTFPLPPGFHAGEWNLSGVSAAAMSIQTLSKNQRGIVATGLVHAGEEMELGLERIK